MSPIFHLQTPPEIARHLAKKAQAKRLSFNLSQKTLANQSGVSLGTLKKFEKTGMISLESLLKIAGTLESLEEFSLLFSLTPPESLSSLEDLLKDKARKRGRR